MTVCLLILRPGAETFALLALLIHLFSTLTVCLLILGAETLALLALIGPVHLTLLLRRLAAGGGALLPLLHVLTFGGLTGCGLACVGRAPPAFFALLLLVLAAVKSTASKRRGAVEPQRAEGESRRQPDSHCRFFHAHHEVPPVPPAPIASVTTGSHLPPERRMNRKK
ncbi:MAG: hypothetical protein K8R18_12135 [Parvibaculum sp.]|uniref:hypothetical protein n=1 Tax=Parvibaculum sp. TaxID=2024848 RepID=UPI0025EB5852|nr:hypothetical protein [Parvibaculum sp.]MCE9650362.1 hypothetical protein [Parvibaculum sp.]